MHEAMLSGKGLMTLLYRVKGNLRGESILKVMARDEGKAMFEALRPICVKVISFPSIENLSSLQAGVMAIPKTTPLPLHLVSYLILPLRATIKISQNEHVLEKSILILTDILCRVQNLEDWDMFNDLFTFLCMLLDKKMSKEAGLKSCSEELTIAALKALKHLLLSTGQRIVLVLYTQLIPVGHCISTLLNSASTSTSNVLCSEAIETLSALAGLNTHPIITAATRLQTTPTDSPEFPGAVDGYLAVMATHVGRRKCGRERILASFLPGLSSNMSRLISSDANTVESFVSLSLITWAHYIALVMTQEEGDHMTQEEGDHMTQEEGDHMTHKDSSDDSRSSLFVERNEAWLKDTGDKLNVLMQRSSLLVASNSWKVRLHMIGWAHSIINHCYSSLGGCVPYLLEVLVTLTHDPYSQVSSVARASLRQFPAGDHTLTSLLGQQLHCLTTSLPRLIRQHDETRKVATLQLLAGYLNLSGNHVILMVHSLPHLSRLVHAMTQTMKLQTDSHHVIATPLPTLDHTSLPTLPFPLIHAHFRSDKVAVLLREVCQLLGCRGDVPVVVDYLMDQFHNFPHFRNEYLLFLSYLLLGAGHRGCCHDYPPPTSVSSDEMFTLIESLMTQLVVPGVWSRSCDPLSSHTSQSEDIFAFLLINMIFTSVHILEENFDPILQQLIYPLMQLLGDNNVGVFSAAMETLLAICSHCGYKSLSHLIDVNADYLTHNISIQLRNMSYTQRQPEAIQVLRGVVSHGEEGVCLMVKDTMRDLLLSLDTHQLDPQLVWEGLRTLSENCERWVTHRNVKGSPVGVAKGVEFRDAPVEEVNREVGIHAIAEYFLQYHTEKKAEKKAEMEGGDGGVEGEEGGGVYSDDRKLPAVEQVCVDMLRRCVHHMSHPMPTVRLMVMKTLQHCMKVLQHDQLTLLPEVHKTWSPLLPRLTDPSHPVARRAWQVILCMSETAGEFLRKRFLEKVWPLLLSSLETMATSSCHRNDILYIQSAEFKLQCCMLECVGGFAKNLSLPSHAVELGCVAVYPYLSTDQPQLLQDLSCLCFHQLISVDPHPVWLVLQQLATPTNHTDTPTNSVLKPYKFPSNPGYLKYTNNVNPLLLKSFSHQM